MLTIQRYEIPNEAGSFTIRMPEHFAVLGIHGHSLVVRGVHDNPELFVDRKFVAVGDGDAAHYTVGHGYLGTLTRGAPGGQFWYQHVFMVAFERSGSAE